MKVLEESSGAVIVSGLSLSVAAPDDGVLETLPGQVQLTPLIWTGKLKYSISYNYLWGQVEQDTFVNRSRNSKAERLWKEST